MLGLGTLARVTRELRQDLTAAQERDPAARDLGRVEILLTYGGVQALLAHRIAHAVRDVGVPLVPHALAYFSRMATGVEIHPGARIGRSFFMDHGTGTVIGETCVIGERVRVYQGVTLGALSLPRGKAHADGRKRHPTLEDDVIIYANATILGGETVIGKGAVVGGNCWVTRSVPPGARVTVDGATMIGPL